MSRPEYIGHAPDCPVDGKPPNKVCTCGAEKRAREADRAEKTALTSKERTPAEELLGSILAIIHGDGGHYQAKHGDAKATEDAIAKYYATRFDALCPHGMPLVENICGPCSQGRPNRRAAETPVKPTGNWPLEVFTPLPPEEAQALRDYGVDDSGDVEAQPETNDDVRALFNKGLGVLKGTKFSFGFETDEEAERAFHYIADLRILETSQPPKHQKAVATPDELVGALQDKVHTDGPGRAAFSVKVEAEQPISNWNPSRVRDGWDCWTCGSFVTHKQDAAEVERDCTKCSRGAVKTGGES